MTTLLLPVAAAVAAVQRDVISTPVPTDDSPATQIGIVVGAIFGTLVVIGAIVTVIITARRQMRGMPPDDEKR